MKIYQYISRVVPLALVCLLFSGASFAQVAIWQEDFAGGLNSVNGTWTNSGPDDWAFSTVGTNGEWSVGTPAFASTTNANGFMLFDADAFNAVVSPNYVARVGVLISPAINLSGESVVWLRYQSNLRHCCTPGALFTVSVSGNGGSTWTDFDASDGTATNAQSANPFIHEFDITAIAALQTDVRIKFTFGDGTLTHYYWVVDDVELFNAALPVELMSFEIE